jgi:hypothetical protein
MGAERWRWSTRDSSRSANRLPRKPSLPYGIARARRAYDGQSHAGASQVGPHGNRTGLIMRDIVAVVGLGRRR